MGAVPDNAAPTLPWQARARIASRAGALLVGLSAAAVLAWALLRPEHPALASGLLGGHLVAQGLTLSWLVAALLAFGATPTKLFGLTIGLSPLRFAVATLAVLAAARYSAHPAAFVLSLFGTHVLGQGVEAYAFGALGRALKPPPAARAAGPASAEEAAPDVATEDGSPPA